MTDRGLEALLQETAKVQISKWVSHAKKESQGGLAATFASDILKLEEEFIVAYMNRNILEDTSLQKDGQPRMRRSSSRAPLSNVGMLERPEARSIPSSSPPVDADIDEPAPEVSDIVEPARGEPGINEDAPEEADISEPPPAEVNIGESPPAGLDIEEPPTTDLSIWMQVEHALKQAEAILPKAKFASIRGYMGKLTVPELGSFVEAVQNEVKEHRRREQEHQRREQADLDLKATSARLSKQ